MGTDRTASTTAMTAIEDRDRERAAAARLANLILSMSSEQLAEFTDRLAPDEQAALERVVAGEARIGWRASPLTMGVRFGELRDLPHTRLLAGKFRDAFEGRSPRQIWNLPPQHGKSLLASRWGPIWALDADPTMSIGLFSYADHLARDHAIFVRNAFIRHGDVLRTRLQPGRRRQDEFFTVEGGKLMAAGLRGSITGFGFNGVVVDDPFKGWPEAHSEAMRRKVWTDYQASVATRLNHRAGIPAFVIVVQTRWHEEDLTGMLLAQDDNDEGEEWELVRLPAIAEDDDDPLGRQRGEALAPTLHDAEELERAMLNRGAYLAAGLYQQRPAPEEGGEIKRAWFQWVSQLPPTYDDELSSWDTKWKDKKGGDFVVGQVWGRIGAAFYCRDQFRGQWGFPTAKAAIALTQVRYPSVRRHVVENAGVGPEMISDLRAGHGKTYTISNDVRAELGIADHELAAVTEVLRRGLPGVMGENVTGSKEVRMRRHTGILEAGNVFLPVGQGWADILVNEAAAFGTQTQHDDCVDAMSQALKRLRNMLPYVPPKSRATAAAPKPSARATQRRY